MKKIKKLFTAGHHKLLVKMLFLQMKKMLNIFTTCSPTAHKWVSYNTIIYCQKVGIKFHSELTE